MPESTLEALRPASTMAVSGAGRLITVVGEQELLHHACRVGRGLDGGFTFLHRAQMLGAAVVGLQPGKVQLPMADDLLRELDYRFARRDAAAVHADLELDVHIQASAGG